MNFFINEITGFINPFIIWSFDELRSTNMIIQNNNYYDNQRFSPRRSKCRYITRRVIRPFYFGTSIEAGKSINIMMVCFKKLAEQ
jgi:hypothetical protein